MTHLLRKRTDVWWGTDGLATVVFMGTANSWVLEQQNSESEKAESGTTALRTANGNSCAFVFKENLQGAVKKNKQSSRVSDAKKEKQANPPPTAGIWHR